jgi:hypothetical protein
MYALAQVSGLESNLLSAAFGPVVVLAALLALRERLWTVSDGGEIVLVMA